MANFKEKLKIAALLIVCIGVPVIAWSLLKITRQSPGEIVPNPTYADLIAIILTAVTVVFAVLAVFIAVLALWGYKAIKEEARSIADKNAIEATSAYLDSQSFQDKLRVVVSSRVDEHADKFFDELKLSAAYDETKSQGSVAKDFPRGAHTVKLQDQLDSIRLLQTSPPVDVSGVARALGIHVWQSKILPENVAGKIFKDIKNGGAEGFSIVVRAQDSLERKRFTVAHEIGHFILHRHLLENDQIVDNALYRSSGLSTSMEAKANGVAADILMPWHLLEPLLDRKRTELAELFQVSRQAIDIRLDSSIARKLKRSA